MFLNPFQNTIIVFILGQLFRNYRSFYSKVSKYNKYKVGEYSANKGKIACRLIQPMNPPGSADNPINKNNRKMIQAIKAKLR